MSFSTSFCLTNIGNLPSNTTLSFYSNADGYTVPFQTTVPLFSVTGNNCPFTLTGVYDGTTIIKVQTSTGNCCAVIDITPNDPCTFCNLGFDQFSASTIGRIVAGNLTGSCDANITDYVIDWKETSNPNIVVFTSGKGTTFLPYGYTHPLTGINSYLVPPGVYKPYLKKIRINGVNYSDTVLTGFVQADLDCFQPISVTVTPLTCSNGTLTNNDYTHLIEFSGASQGIIPSTIQQVFQLSSNTNYFAWKFWGYDISDTLKITYYGSNYNNTPIILEYWNVGNNNDINNTYYLNTFPKTAKTFDDSTSDSGQGFKKVTCLSGITRSVNDYLIIEVIPNQTNSKTNFKLTTKCLTSFNCDTCFDNFYNNGIKIIQSSVIGTNLGCNQNQVSFRLSGCSESQLSTSDLYKYCKTEPYTTPSTMGYVLPDTNGCVFYNEIFTYNVKSCSNGTLNNQGTVCSIPTTGQIITFSKNNSGPGGIGNVYMTFTSISDFNAHYNSYLSLLNSPNGNPTDPTTPQWYRYYVLTTPVPTNPNDPCGDTTVYREFFFHPSSVVTTGQTGNVYFMNLTMPKITKQMVFTNCDISCNNSIDTIINNISSSSDGVSFSYTNYAGNRIQYPFNKGIVFSINTQTRNSQTRSYGISYSSVLNETKPFSGNTNGTFSYIPSLSAITCSFNGFYRTSPNSLGNSTYYRSLAQVNALLPNPLNSSDFKIQIAPTVLGMYPYTPPVAQPQFSPPVTNYIDVYQKVNGVGTVLQPSYFI
jgi:hypothetical protein